MCYLLQLFMYFITLVSTCINLLQLFMYIRTCLIVTSYSCLYFVIFIVPVTAIYISPYFCQCYLLQLFSIVIVTCYNSLCIIYLCRCYLCSLYLSHCYLLQLFMFRHTCLCVARYSCLCLVLPVRAVYVSSQVS